MAPLNQERREAIADAAIELLGLAGTHGLTHRAVDEHLGLPRGSTSNYFRSRDALLTAAAERVVEVHFRWLAEIRGRHPERLARERVIDILADVLDAAVGTHRLRYLAMFHLALEGTLRPELRATMSRLAESSAGLTHGAHVGDGIDPSGPEVALLQAFYNGLLWDALVIPETLDHRSPGELVRALLTRIWPA